MSLPTPRLTGRQAPFRVEQPTRRHRPDYWLLVIVALLLATGLIVVYAISPALSATHGGSDSHYVSRQLIAIGLSIVAFMITANVPLKQWSRWQVVLLGVAALGTLIALIIPVNPEYPAHRWIRLGSLSLQSVEVLKFAWVVWAAGFLTRRIKEGTVGNTKLTLQPLVITVIVIGLVVAGVQSDLGSTGVIVVMLGAMALMAGMPWKRILMIAGVVIIGTILAVSAIPYRRERLLSYLHPQSNCLTTGYQACQALIAVGSGGMIGLGLGRSVQAYGYLPEAQNDSIFAIFAEKFGFIGVSVLLALFVVLFARLRRLMERAADDFSRLVVAGVLAWLSTQTIINIGAMIGLLPLKGITLPFISYGGTSVLFVGAALGLVFQVSRYTSFQARNVRHSKQRTSYEDSDDGRRVRRAYHPDPGSRR
jgi:cell division protein FtsW